MVFPLIWTHSINGADVQNLRPYQCFLIEMFYGVAKLILVNPLGNDKTSQAHISIKCK